MVTKVRSMSISDAGGNHMQHVLFSPSDSGFLVKLRIFHNYTFIVQAAKVSMVRLI